MGQAVLRKHLRKMVFTTIDDFYLTDAELHASPSRGAGVDESTESQLRLYGCELIQEAGVLLKLGQVVMATGQVLFHRFYSKRSMAQFNVKVRTQGGGVCVHARGVGGG